MAQCVQEEERIKARRGDSVHLAQLKKKNVNSKPSFKKPGSSGYGGQGSSSGSGSSSRITTIADGTKNFPVPIDTCLHCKKKGHYKRDCPDFLKSLFRRSKDEITFVDESMYLEYSVNTWWIDSGATVHVPILCRCSIQGGTFQGAKERLVWPTGRKMKSKPLEI